MKTQDGLEEELIKISEIIMPKKFEQEKKECLLNEDQDEELNSHSSNISNASSTKNLKDLEDEEIGDEINSDIDRDLNGEQALENSHNETNFLIGQKSSQLDKIHKNEGKTFQQ